MNVQASTDPNVIKRKLEISVEGRIVESMEFQFDAKEMGLIRDYCTNAWRLRQSAIFNDKAVKHFKLSCNQVSGFASEGDPIDDEAWDSALHRFRPLILQKYEPSNFYSICSIIRKRINSQQVRASLKLLKQQFRGELAAMQPYFGDRGQKLSMEDIFDRWLYAFEYHREQDKRDFFERTKRIAPELEMRHHIYFHAVEKLRAIMGLFKLLVDLLGNDIKPDDLRALEAEGEQQNG